MYNILALLTGILISTFVAINGKLSTFYGEYISSAIIHLAGALFAILIFIISGKKFKLKKNIPLWYYSGGFIGVLATLSNNFSFGKIPVTNIIALGLLGQIITSLVVDQFGFFNMVKHKINIKSVFGIALSFLGVLYMLDFSDMTSLLAIILSFSAGICTVIVRSVNANLGKSTSELEGALIHHVIGFLFSILLMFVFSNDIFEVEYIPKNPILYIGGVLGLVVILIYNYIVPKISSYKITLISFIGQVLSGIIIDLILGTTWNISIIKGCFFLCIGICITNILSKNKDKIYK